MWITIKSWPIEPEELDAQDYLLCYHNGPNLNIETEDWYWNFEYWPDIGPIGPLSIYINYRLTFLIESIFWNYKANYKYNNLEEPDNFDITIYKLYYICG